MTQSAYSRRSFLKSTALTGAALACSAAGAQEVESQKSQKKDESEKSQKKGVCFTRGGKRSLPNTVALNPAWMYTWGERPPEDLPDSVQFCPMIWGGGKKEELKKRISAMKPKVESDKLKFLLGFNEPDKKKQSNMTVDKAIKLWPALMDLGVPLVSPACAHPDGEWMKDFMAKIDKQKLRVDYVGVHSYGGVGVKAVMNKLERVARLYKRPLWLTEFAVGDWKAKTRKENQYTPEKVLKFMKQVLPAFEKKKFIARYAWYSPSPSHKALGPSALFDEESNLTALGKFYASF